MPAGLNLRNLNCHRKEDAMKIIETERWVPSKEDPSRSEYIGQRTGQEVFEELRQQLENMGCLPDEYFLLDQQWEKGREIPKGADIFCTTDYGASGDTAFFKKHSNINGFRTPEQRNYLYSALLKPSISAAIARFIFR